MKCLKCSKKMVVTSKDVSHNDKTGQKYSRTIYHCKKDDVWSNIEIPKEQ